MVVCDFSKLAKHIQAARAYFSVREGGDRSEYMFPLTVHFSKGRLECGVIEKQKPKSNKGYFYPWSADFKRRREKREVSDIHRGISGSTIPPKAHAALVLQFSRHTRKGGEEHDGLPGLI
jgi:hypothetical protein